MALVIFVEFGVSRGDLGEAFPGFEVGDVVGVLAFIGGTDIVCGLGHQLPGYGIGHALVAQDSGFAVRSDRVIYAGESNKSDDDEIEGTGQFHLFGVILAWMGKDLGSETMFATFYGLNRYNRCN